LQERRPWDCTLAVTMVLPILQCRRRCWPCSSRALRNRQRQRADDDRRRKSVEATLHARHRDVGPRLPPCRSDPLRSGRRRTRSGKQPSPWRPNMPGILIGGLPSAAPAADPGPLDQLGDESLLGPQADETVARQLDTGFAAEVRGLVHDPATGLAGRDPGGAAGGSLYSRRYRPLDGASVKTTWRTAPYEYARRSRRKFTPRRSTGWRGSCRRRAARLRAPSRPSRSSPSRGRSRASSRATTRSAPRVRGCPG
jgi:hypothetical protein